MRVLHYNLYNNAHIGMCNLLMSVENALIIAKLTGRDKIIFYGDGTFFNESKLSVPDLFDINFPYEWVKSNDIDPSIPSLPYDFFNVVIYDGEMPSNAFINKRQNFINLQNYQHIQEFRTLDKNTLAYYSYLFYLKPSIRQEILEFVKATLVPKQVYVDVANHYVKALGSFSSVHMRRGDYVYHANERDRHITVASILPVVKANIAPDAKLVIHSDETDTKFFADFKKVYPNLSLIETELVNVKIGITGESEGRLMDKAEQGLVSLLIASHSNNFIGTMFSTFTGMIQRYRMYNGLKEDFKYLYSQDDDVVLVNGRFAEDAHGEQTWNRVKLPEKLRSIAFWFREWQEAYVQKIEVISQSLQFFPNFVTNQEMDHIMRRFNMVKVETYERENRDRWTPHISQDRVVAGLIERACKVLGYDYNNVEPTMQVFKQNKGGQTFLHTDSLFEDYQGKRISSVLFYLNDDFKGSELSFPYLGLRWQPTKGAMLAYPLVNNYNEQDVMWSHAASVITEGEKYMCYFSLKEKPFHK